MGDLRSELFMKISDWEIEQHASLIERRSGKQYV